MAVGMRVAVIVAVLGLIPAQVIAGPIELGDTLQLLHSDGSLGGGPFHFDDLTNGAGEDVLTFCLQHAQFIDYTSLFTVGGITDYTDDAAGDDYISAETRWIYSTFLAGGLGAYQPDAIQGAIWTLEGEWSSSFGNSLDLVEAARVAVFNGFTDENVKALNLFYADGRPAQDQLYMTPVPEPASLLLFGTGLAAVLRRRLTRAGSL